MKTHPLLVPLLLLAVVESTPAREVDQRSSPHRGERLRWARPASDREFISSSDASGLARAASNDTLFLYGGLGSSQGTFQNPFTGEPEWQGWTSVDRTFRANHWQRSPFNAETLGNHGPGNLAYWCGVSAAQEPGWGSPPGYGNSWDDAVVFEAPMTDPAVAQDVELSFVFHHDSEPGYDFFDVDYDSAGTWVRTLRVDKTDADSFGNFTAPGVSYTSLATGPIRFTGGDYGAEGDVLRLRLRFSSDGAWSDEDGLASSFAGAVQVDDVRVRWDDGTGTMQESFEDFESEDPVWRPVWTPFAGDFAALYGSAQTLDPCVVAEGVVGFIDTGQVLCPEPFHPDCLVGTGGSTGLGGFPWVVNYEGGLSDGLEPVYNEVWSPEIAWDLPTSEDDGLEWSGLRLGFDVYTDLPLSNGIFYVWALRSSPDGVRWSRWQNNGLVYFNRERQEWIRVEEDVSAVIVDGRLTLDAFESVQIALGVRDLADWFGFPGDTATASPLFDNVTLAKYRLRGPQIRVFARELAADAFPAGGTLDTSDLGSLDVRFDMAKDVGSGLVDLGDSLVVRVEAVIPGTTVTEVRMQWALAKNPLFDDTLRQPPSGPEHVDVDTSAPLLWTGEVLGDDIGSIAWSFDLPDQDFLYPGDVLRYRFLALDDEGRTSGLPTEESGLLDGVGWDPRFAMHALPTLREDLSENVVQPSTLVVLQTGQWRDETLWDVSLGGLDLVRGVDFDVYGVLDPEATESASFGSADGSGATLAQIAGYANLFLDFGARSESLLGDGVDGAPELPLLTAWHGLDGPRAAVHFGTDLVSVLSSGSAVAEAYLENILAVQLGIGDIRERLEAGFFERVTPIPSSPFEREYLLVPTCGVDGDFDGILPASGVSESFGASGFARSGGIDEDGFAAVIHDRGLPSTRKVDMTFSFTLPLLVTEGRKASGPYTTASWLLSEIFDYLNVATPAPPADRSAALDLRAYPSPFNPSTTVRLSLPAAGEATVEIFDLRGRRVRTLFDGGLPRAGRHDFRWDGRDDAGASLASGVYVVRAQTGGQTLTQKVSLLK